MAIVGDDTLTALNTLAVVISIIIPLYAGFRWLKKENIKSVQELKDKLFGKPDDKDDNGVLGQMEEDTKKYIDARARELELEIRYLQKDIKRIEKSLDILTRGRYGMAVDEAKEEHDEREYSPDKSDNDYNRDGEPHP